MPTRDKAAEAADILQPGIELLMQRVRNIVSLAICLTGLVISLPAQEVIDRIVARVDTDIILLSDVRELARYQSFVDGEAESDSQILDRLIDQWIVRNEAKAALFPQPSDEDVQRSLDRLKRSFSTPEAFQDRENAAGLTDEDVVRMLTRQLYLSNYLDSRFRASVQIDQKDIEEFYKTRVVPRAQTRGQSPPTMEAARGFIQEALVQRAINEQADRWLKESRSRIRIEKFLDEKSK
jgi:parvulin-like peptidyl-prolyl isomerase